MLNSRFGCISYYSYIKPQRSRKWKNESAVVYRTIPTSNHNVLAIIFISRSLYIVLFLHQTTTNGYGYLFKWCCISYYSYIKPQLRSVDGESVPSCISYYSYIKPQPDTTSNDGSGGCISYYSYIKPQLCLPFFCSSSVVYRTIPTSNHNKKKREEIQKMLYIVLFLHQTTTRRKGENPSHLLYIVLFLHQTTTAIL